VTLTNRRPPPYTPFLPVACPAAGAVILYTRRRSPSKASAADIKDADKCDCQPSDRPSGGLRQCVHVTVQF